MYAVHPASNHSIVHRAAVSIGEAVRAMTGRREIRFIVAGGLASAVNWFSRFPLALFWSFETAVALAYGVGMGVGFVLTLGRRHTGVVRRLRGIAQPLLQGREPRRQRHDLLPKRDDQRVLLRVAQRRQIGQRRNNHSKVESRFSRPVKPSPQPPFRTRSRHPGPSGMSSYFGRKLVQPLSSGVVLVVRNRRRSRLWGRDGVGFVLYRTWVFEGTEGRVWEQLPRFLLVNGFGLAVVMASACTFLWILAPTPWLSEGSTRALAHSLALIVGAAVNFLGHRTLTFHVRRVEGMVAVDL